MRTTRIIWGVAGMLLAVAPAAPAWAAAAAPGPVMTGTVYRPDGEPAAKVQLQAEGWHTEVIDGKDGSTQLTMPQFTIQTDAAGRYRVRLSHRLADYPERAGAGSRWNVLLVSPQGAGYARLNVEAGPDQTALTHDIHLLRGDRVKGTVLGYPGGKPIAGADVFAVADEGITYSVPISRTVTDERGRFTIPADLPPGHYRVGAAAKEYGLVDDYDSGAAKEGQARSITLQMAHAVRVLGRVLAADGTPLANQRATLNTRCDWGSTEAPITTNARGQFSIVQSPGENEYDRWWNAGCREIHLSVAHQGHRSDAVVINPMESSRAEVTLTLK